MDIMIFVMTRILSDCLHVHDRNVLTHGSSIKIHNYESTIFSRYPCIGVSKLTIITTTTIESITSRYFNIRNNNNHHNYKDGVALDF